MNFQQKLFETSAQLRARAAHILGAALASAREQAEAAAERAEKLRQPVTIIGQAGREIGKVARRHATRFVRQNANLASKVRDDVGTIARKTLNSLRNEARPRKPAVRKRRVRAQSRAA